MVPVSSAGDAEITTRPSHISYLNIGTLVATLVGGYRVSEWPGVSVIMMISLKGSIRDFYNLLTAPRSFSNTCAQVIRAQSCANHVQNIERLLRATCVPRGSKEQLSYEVWQSFNRVYLSSIWFLKPLPDEGGKETGVPAKTPYDFRKCRMLRPENSNP